jgi:hypothetical protein
VGAEKRRLMTAGAACPSHLFGHFVEPAGTGSAIRVVCASSEVAYRFEALQSTASGGGK